MFDIDAGKLLILGVIALVILGPKELPRVMRQVGAALGKMRRMASEFQTQFMDAMKESEMAELKKDMEKMADQARVDVDYDPVSETNRQIREAIDGKPAHEITASTPVPVDPDPDNKVYAADIPPVTEPASTSASPAAANAETAAAPDPHPQPARKVGEA